MRPLPDPIKVYDHACGVGDHRLADLLASRLFPWRRSTADPSAPPTLSALRTVRRLVRALGKRGRD